METLDYKRLIYQKATEKNKAFFDKLWSLPERQSPTNTFWWITTMLELIAFYIISFQNPGNWLINLFLFWMWFYNGFLVTAGLGIAVLSRKLDYITIDMAEKLYRPGFEKRVDYKFTLNTFLCIMLLVALVARGWTFTGALMVYSLIVGYLITVTNKAMLLIWARTDFEESI